MRAERIWLRDDEVSDVERLSTDECWALLASAPIGRLGVRLDQGVDIYPVNFTVNEQIIYIRSAPGSKLVDIAHESSVAFEVDGRAGRKRWSVVVRGEAERLSYDAEIERSGVLALATMTSSAKSNYVKITPSSVSGRRFIVSGTTCRSLFRRGSR